MEEKKEDTDEKFSYDAQINGYFLKTFHYLGEKFYYLEDNVEDDFQSPIMTQDEIIFYLNPSERSELFDTYTDF